MNENDPTVIQDIPDFLAHAIALEYESVERYQELADSMDVHNNPRVAELFRKLAHYGELHARDIEHHADGIELPGISPGISNGVRRKARRAAPGMTFTT